MSRTQKSQQKYHKIDLCSISRVVLSHTIALCEKQIKILVVSIVIIFQIFPSGEILSAVTGSLTRGTGTVRIVNKAFRLCELDRPNH